MSTPTIRRAWIITPAVSQDRFATAQSCGADVSMVDLEDSVAPADKHRARLAAQTFFEPPTAPACPLGIRINAPTTAEGLRDLLALQEFPSKPAIVLVPKVESARDLELVASILDTHDYEPELYALIETPRAIVQLPQIVRASRLGGVVFGAADYAAASGCRLSWEALLYARSALATHVTAAGIPAVDSPFFNLQDSEGLRAEADLAKGLGFTGKGAVHPRQLPIIARAFAPTLEEIASARSIVAAAQISDQAVTSVDGTMVGRPFFTSAVSLLEQVDPEQVEQPGMAAGRGRAMSGGEQP